MTTTINASTSAGLVNTADTSGILQLQTAGTAAVTIDASQNVTLVKPVVLSGSSSGAITLAAPAVAGTNTATLPAATGTVMVSGNMPAFSAYNTGGTGVTTNTFTKIILNNEEFDTNNNFDSTTNYRFTPTVAGYYQINGIAYLTASSVITSGYLAIYKNGSIYKQSGLGVVSSSVNSIFASINFLVYLNGSTDYVELYGLIVASSNPSIAAGSAYTSFSGSLARAA